MAKSRVRTGYTEGEIPANTSSDFDWVHAHETELLEKYGEAMILVYQQRVIGVGQTYQEMVEDAERNLPSDVTEATPITYFLYRRHPFFRVRPTEACVS